MISKITKLSKDESLGANQSSCIIQSYLPTIELKQNTIYQNTRKAMAYYKSYYYISNKRSGYSRAWHKIWKCLMLAAFETSEASLTSSDESCEKKEKIGMAEGNITDNLL